MKQILFDLDGTLTDSGEGIIHCAQETLAHYGLPIPSQEELRTIVGPPLRQSLHRLGILPEQTDEAIEIYRRHYVDHGQFENFPYPGIENLLQKLKEEGHQLYVATSKPEAMSIRILQHFGLAKYFDIICGAESDRSRDTKAKVIAYLLEQITPLPGKMIMVGDTVYDVEGANTLNIPCVGVSWGYGVISEMQSAGAIAIAETMDHLYQILSQF
jgi:phosphoglycolate phosphatase